MMWVKFVIFEKLNVLLLFLMEWVVWKIVLISFVLGIILLFICSSLFFIILRFLRFFLKNVL